MKIGRIIVAGITAFALAMMFAQTAGAYNQADTESTSKGTIFTPCPVLDESSHPNLKTTSAKPKPISTPSNNPEATVTVTVVAKSPNSNEMSAWWETNNLIYNLLGIVIAFVAAYFTAKQFAYILNMLHGSDDSNKIIKTKFAMGLLGCALPFIVPKNWFIFPEITFAAAFFIALAAFIKILSKPTPNRIDNTEHLDTT